MPRPRIHCSISELRDLATHDDWKKREDAGFELRARMEENLSEGLPIIDEWLFDHDDRVRRAAVLACMIRKKYGTRYSIGAVLDRIETVLGDDSAYVKKCTGPFVLGFLGYTYPGIVLPRIEGWCQLYFNGPPNICWNLASAFSQSLGRKYPDAALQNLKLLINHSNAQVLRVIARSLINIASIDRNKVIQFCDECHPCTNLSITLVRKHLQDHSSVP